MSGRCNFLPLHLNPGQRSYTGRNVQAIRVMPQVSRISILEYAAETVGLCVFVSIRILKQGFSFLIVVFRIFVNLGARGVSLRAAQDDSAVEGR